MEKVYVASARSAVFKYTTVSLRLYSSAFRCRITVNIDTHTLRHAHTKTRLHPQTDTHKQPDKRSLLISTINFKRRPIIIIIIITITNTTDNYHHPGSSLIMRSTHFRQIVSRLPQSHTQHTTVEELVQRLKHNGDSTRNATIEKPQGDPAISK